MSTQASKGQSHRAGEARSTGNESGQNLQQNLSELGTQAKDMAQAQIENLRETAGEYLEQGRAKTQELQRTLEEQIRDQPLKAAAIACGIGFVLGMFMMRR